MGKEKIVRPLLLPNGLTASETITASSDVAVSGTLTGSSNVSAGGTLTASSAFIGSVISVSSSQVLTSILLTILTATSAAGYTLPAPVVGLEKRIVKTGNSTQALTVATDSTTVTVDGSSGTNLVFNGRNQVAYLQASSTSRWVLLSSTAQIGDIT